MHNCTRFLCHFPVRPLPQYVTDSKAKQTQFETNPIRINHKCSRRSRGKERESKKRKMYRFVENAPLKLHFTAADDDDDDLLVGTGIAVCLAFRIYIMICCFFLFYFSGRCWSACFCLCFLVK